jgi:hypothetical protein
MATYLGNPTYDVFNFLCTLARNPVSLETGCDHCFQAIHTISHSEPANSTSLDTTSASKSQSGIDTKATTCVDINATLDQNVDHLRNLLHIPSRNQKQLE